MTELDLDRIMRNRSALAASILLLATAAKADPLPDAIGHQLPLGYVMLEAAQGRLTVGRRDDYVVALHRPSDDPAGPIGDGSAPAPPLLLFGAAPDGPYVLAGRNDDVVMRHDQGGQCDPFDPQRGLVMKGAHVNVQTRLCAAITGRYITFRYDQRRGKLLFDRQSYHGWKFDRNNAPNAPALVPDGPPAMKRADLHHPVGFSIWWLVF